MHDSKKRKIDLPQLREEGFPSIGKARARREFLPLIDTIADGNTPIEITDNGKPVAVILGYNAFQEMYSLANSKRAKRKLESLDGSVTIQGDLEQARRQLEREAASRVKRRSALL